MPKTPKQLPPEKLKTQPGKEKDMLLRPTYDNGKPGCGRFVGKVVLITGGDSGIGRATALSFAKEGAEIAIVYLNEHEDAKETAGLLQAHGIDPLVIPTDLGREKNCERVINQVIKKYGRLDVLINNAGEQHPQENIEDITAEQMERTFATNFYSQFFMAKHAVPHMKKGCAIVNTASVTAYQGYPQLLDYSATKGAVVAFTRSLSGMLAKKGIRVNAVAPGPIRTPLIPSTFTRTQVMKFGKDTPLGRAGQPFEVASCFVFLASDDASYVTGQVVHPNGGTIVNG